MKKIKNKKGAAMLIILLISLISFPITLCATLDAINIYGLNKQMKTALNAATLSAVSRFDITHVHDQGEFYIQESEANIVAKKIYAKNMNLNEANLSPNDTNSGINGTPKFQCIIYNKYSDKKEQFPMKGRIDKEIYPGDIQIEVDRPTVFAIAKIQYKSIFGKRYDIIMYSSSQINKR